MQELHIAVSDMLVCFANGLHVDRLAVDDQIVALWIVLPLLLERTPNGRLEGSRPVL